MYVMDFTIFPKQLLRSQCHPSYHGVSSVSPTNLVSECWTPMAKIHAQNYVPCLLKLLCYGLILFFRAHPDPILEPYGTLSGRLLDCSCVTTTSNIQQYVQLQEAQE